MGIRLATIDDIVELSKMLMNMYIELQPEYAVRNIATYASEVADHLASEKHFVYVDDEYRGFFTVVDETEDLTPSLKIYNGIRVYVKPEYRKGRVLKEFYDKMFKDFDDGNIVGLTVVESEHIKVLEKRHTRIANLYLLNRSKK